MKQRSVRNWIGGFCGGFPGVLSSGAVASLVEPFTAFSITFGITAFGVIAGWWYKEIWRSIVTNYRIAQAKHEDLRGMSSLLLTILAMLCGASASRIMNDIHRMKTCQSRTIAWCGRASYAVFQFTGRTIGASVALIPATWRFVTTAPARFRSWDKAHIMNRALALETLAAITLLVGIPFATYLLALEGHVPMDPKDTPESTTAIAFLMAMLGVSLYQSKFANDRNALRNYFREEEILARVGYTGLYGYYLLQFMRSIIGFVVFGTLFFVWVMAGTVIAMGVITFGTIVLVGLRTIYRVSRRRGHVLCLATTLMTTAISWAIFHSRFDEIPVLWSVAFGSGIAAGALTEFFQSLSTKFHVRISRALKKGILEESASNFVFFWFTRNRLPQFMRAVCFGTPVEAPVRVLNPEQAVF